MEKAEQQLQKKLEKRGDTSSSSSGGNANRYKSNECSASQVISKKDARAEAAGLTSKDIRIENFDIAYGEKVLLKGADVTLVYGRRYGMVGRNGLGKSTMLKMISAYVLCLLLLILVEHCP